MQTIDNTVNLYKIAVMVAIFAWKKTKQNTNSLDWGKKEYIKLESQKTMNC